MRRRRCRGATTEIESRVTLLNERVRREARERPAVYWMLSPDGEVIYVGKARKLRTRLLSYFRAAYPAEKAARIIREAASLEWEYQPSEFAAVLEELRAIKRWRPRFNVAMKRDAWHYAFVRVVSHPAPRFQVVRSAGDDAYGTYYGPFSGAHQIGMALRELNDALGLRDCRLDQPMHFADQRELPVAMPRTPGCIRYEIGKCLGPCVGAVTLGAYHAQFRAAIAFLEGRHDEPIGRLRAAMASCSEHLEFERAAALRDKLARLESLRDQFARLRFAVESLSFVYVVPGFDGDDRAYIIHRGRVRAELPAPRSTAERAALEARAAAVIAPGAPRSGESCSNSAIPAHEVDELTLVAAWFRKRPYETARGFGPNSVKLLYHP